MLKEASKGLSRGFSSDSFEMYCRILAVTCFIVQHATYKDLQHISLLSKCSATFGEGCYSYREILYYE